MKLTATRKDFYIKTALQVFPGSFINGRNELILIPKTNLYFGLGKVFNEVDFKASMLEYCSRDCHKTQPYCYRKRNEEYWSNCLRMVNQTLETNFSQNDMAIIYSEIGCGVHHKLAVEFVESGYDFQVLNRKPERQLVLGIDWGEF